MAATSNGRLLLTIAILLEGEAHSVFLWPRFQPVNEFVVFRTANAMI